MRFRTRAFLFTFIPIALVLGLSFLLVRHSVESTVRAGLRESLRRSQRTVAQMRDQNSLQNSHLLKTLSSDDGLKAAVQRSAARNANSALSIESMASGAVLGDGKPRAGVELAPAAESTPTSGDGATLPELDDLLPSDSLQEQLLRFGVQGGVDLIMVTRPDGTPLSGAVRAGGGSAELVPLYTFPQSGESGLLLFGGEPFQTATARLDANGVTLGLITVGERLKLSTFATSAVLLHEQWVMQSDIEKSRLAGIGGKLSECKAHTECSLEMNGVEWLSLPILEDSKGEGWMLYSLVNVDEAIAPINAGLRRIFLCVVLLSIVVTLLCSFAWSRAIVQPIATMVSHLHEAARTGKLPEFESDLSNVVEIRDLAGTYNRAAATVKKAQVELNDAYVEFVYSLANALDARDSYTAGHSKRVSDLSCAIARAMGQNEDEIERLRIGALLHDIGKIGIGDSVLQHPGKLTKEQFQTIKKHPLIGRRILQGVDGFAMYLPAVELHHENWDGSGYPKRQCGQETPLDARIVHVADAYDAITTDRSYRKGRTHDEAMDILAENAGTQFDPDVVAALFRLAGFGSEEAMPASVVPPPRSPLQVLRVRTVEPASELKTTSVEDAATLHALDAAPDSSLPVC